MRAGGQNRGAFEFPQAFDGTVVVEVNVRQHDSAQKPIRRLIETALQFVARVQCPAPAVVKLGHVVVVDAVQRVELNGLAVMTLGFGEAPARHEEIGIHLMGSAGGGQCERAAEAGFGGGRVPIQVVIDERERGGGRGKSGSSETAFSRSWRAFSRAETCPGPVRPARAMYTLPSRR